ncbi:hypothetical protein RINTHH_11930 [Richelia intracellularis HH01]|jgi:hypothetical protein|uniref:Uncharacterized protein n=1 Tax=Richelia intracellularis HH01 TaxID=1165094 RepID=M1X079_9NOST|nr:hypothetical protein [Richelia intracellularis]CCH67348.1 hypothetical protein RINTHH_11930 [Richelia intracellularis HH01]
MDKDLQGLEITPQELRYLTNLPVKYELTKVKNYFQIIFRLWTHKFQVSESPTIFFLGLSLYIITYLLFKVMINFLMLWLPLPSIPSWILLILSILSLIYLTQFSLYLLWWQRKKIVNVNMTAPLRILLNDIDRYNALIRVIDINDQIEAAGNQEVALKDRDKVVSALKIARIDLVKALKTEKILRENKKFIINNSDLFTENLTNLTGAYITEKAAEHGRLLNETLQIILEVENEMEKLQGQS